jgi:hypothetical protein
VTVALDVREADFTRSVIELAYATRWLCSHFHDSRRQVRRRSGEVAWIGDKHAAGFPDLVLVRGDRQVVAELKSRTGRVRPNQQRWLDAFAACGVEVHVWRPADWDQIVKALT